MTKKSASFKYILKLNSNYDFYHYKAFIKKYLTKEVCPDSFKTNVNLLKLI